MGTAAFAGRYQGMREDRSMPYNRDCGHAGWGAVAGILLCLGLVVAAMPLMAYL